ncbi:MULTISPECIES: helix-turn-helix transcriptional regulator [unclassified Streptococcus]|uniref:helix-turn-helix transcriptional regulator n=1 Tax=unclassified Streptococcus TaxID=2608887 RepID=UPI0015640263|nr:MULTISPECIES: helix-turn-helix transcriptional regulator [unclassified Streptococcus]
MNRLKELRQKKGDTQEVVAKAMGVTRRGYQKWENEESQIKPEKAQQLADYFGVSVGSLLGYDEVPKNLIEELELQLDHVLTPTEKEDLENNPELRNHYLSIVRNRLLYNQRKEVEKTAQAFDKDFIRLLKEYSIYLSDNQIEQIKDLMKTMSNINNRYLMVAMGAGYQSEMEIAKTYDFKQLFEYSSTWKDNYSSIEKESDD